VLHGWGANDGGGEDELEQDAQSSSGLVNSPMVNSDARSVRAANAVPIWQATIQRT
jgi:hypothetical protein